MEDINKLVEKIKLKDKKAFEKLYTLTSKELYWYCLRLCGNDSDAQDLLQDVYFNAWKKIEQYNGTSFTAWLHSIAHNRWINKIKNTAKEISLDDEFIELSEDEKSNPANQSEKILKNEEIMSIINTSLSDMQRMTVLMHYYDGKSVSEIADELNFSETAIKSVLYRAREKLKIKLKDKNLYSMSLPILFRYDAEQTGFTDTLGIIKKSISHKITFSTIKIPCIIATISAGIVIGGVTISEIGFPTERIKGDNGILLYETSEITSNESTFSETSSTENTISETKESIESEVSSNENISTEIYNEEENDMNKTVNSMISTAVAVTTAITTTTAMTTTTFAESYADNVVTESTYNHEQAMEEFREYIEIQAEKMYDKMQIVDEISNNQDNFQVEINRFYVDENNYEYFQEGDVRIIYTLKDGIAEKYDCNLPDFYKKASDGRFYCNISKKEADGTLQRFLEQFETKIIDGISYVVLDGREYSYCLDTDINGYDYLYFNCLGFLINPNAWYKNKFRIPESIIELAENGDIDAIQSIADTNDYNNNVVPEYVYYEEYKNFSYLSDKIYEIVKLDTNQFFGNSKSSPESYRFVGFETFEQACRYGADSTALRTILAVSRDDDEIYQRILPFIKMDDESNYSWNFSINEYGNISQEDIELFKKYYDGDYVKYDVDYDDKLTVKDLAYVKRYLINESDLTALQKYVAKNSYTDDVDIKTVADIAHKIVGLDN